MARKRENEIVKKSNALIRAHWIVSSIWEPRLVALVASKIRVEDEDLQTYKINISELISGTSQRRGGRLYEEIETAIKKIMGRVIEIYGDTPRQKTYYSLFSKCFIDEDKGFIEVRFDSDLKPHYLGLKERFTQYSLEEFMKLPSTYSQRLFEILSSWKNLQEGEVTITIDELHKQLDSPVSLIKNFKDFRVRVLEQSHKDISANSDSSLDYEWQPIKKGRKVTAVRFIFDRGRIEKERREQEKEAQRLQSKRNNELVMAAWKCSKNMAAVPILEQDAVQRDQKQEVCNMCQSQEMVKSLFPLECRRYKRVEVLVD